LKIEIIEEENYFFKFSKFQQKLLELYQKYPDFVIPEHRLKEITNFVSFGLEDFSVSRLKEKMPWGVSVPNDDKHVMYVWFDALTNYISALGWPEENDKFEKFWGTNNNTNALQVAGKDNLRQQAAMWQAMLLAADLPTSRQIFIHGFITSGGEKMSKSLGNVIDPVEYAKKYGTDALRYYLLAKISPTEDSDFTKEKFEEVYNADLANGLGNLVARVAKLAELQNLKVSNSEPVIDPTLELALKEFRFDKVLENIWSNIRIYDGIISSEELWKNTEKKIDRLETIIENILNIAYNLQPFLPETAEKIERQFKGLKIRSSEPLFPRLK
jgi:methionyl-tRNA synthetase